MEHINDELTNLKRLVKMLAEQFGASSEIILHDLTKDYSNTIVAIENNHITGRKIGDGSTNLGLEVLRKAPFENGDIYNYVTQTADGKILRSSTMYFRDENGKAIGSLCINTDLTSLLTVQKHLEDFTMVTPEKKIEETFTQNVGELISFFLEQSKQIVHKPVHKLTKADKIEILSFLDEKGFFLITHAGDAACEFLNISKFTLYRYLGDIREEEKQPDLPQVGSL